MSSAVARAALCRGALVLLKASAAECAAQAADFSPSEAAAGLLAANELRALFLALARSRGCGTSASPECRRWPLVEPSRRTTRR